MAHSAKGVANAILNKASEARSSVSPLKLQKLLYYVCGYYLAATGKPAIDIAFEAWENGPVVPEIYHDFKSYRWSNITGRANYYDRVTNKLLPSPIPTDDPILNKSIDFVWKTYSCYTAEQLSDMTHAVGSPWDRTRKAHPSIRNADISNEVIEDHFRPFVTRNAG